MKILKNIKLSKRILFASLAAVALLGATQPVLAETYLFGDSASPEVNQRELEWELPPAPKLPPVPQLPESFDDLWLLDEDRTQPPYGGALLPQQPLAPELPLAPQWPELPPAPKLPPVPQLPESFDDLWLLDEDRTQPPYGGALLPQQPLAPELPPLQDSPRPESPSKPNNPSISETPEVDDYRRGFEDGRNSYSAPYGFEFARLYGSKYSEEYKKGYMAGYLKGPR
ncbi:hypothetical protein ACR9F1_02725 [Streptococcus dysgalactiae subsp. equisimilis]|uniref:hypothetical protein n=1 Tax=Streptococcus dysgalactiae TaxID=1334 RepID=UPI003FD86177